MNPVLRRLSLWAALIVIVIAVGMAVLRWPAPAVTPGGLSGKAIGGDFTLRGADGPVRLADQHGRITLLFFGYTYCPDICPTALSTAAAALKRLTTDERTQVAVIFVSVDPERDTPERLKEYTAFFDPQIQGATGEPAVIAEVAKRYGVFYARQPAEDGRNYSIDHTANVYLIDREGRLHDTLPHAVAPETLAAAIRALR